MKAETPVLWLDKVGSYSRDFGRRWLCGTFLDLYFEAKPKRISIGLTTRPSKDALAVELNRSRENGILLWRPLEGARWPSSDALLNPFEAWLENQLGDVKLPVTLYVTVYIH